MRRSLLELFADRQKQLERFHSSLAGKSTRRIIFVTGSSGIGKSWLLRKFEAEAKGAGAHTALLDFADSQAYDVLMLVRRFRDLLGPEHFNELTAAINESTNSRLTLGTSSTSGPASVNVNVRSDGGSTASVGDVAGGNIVKDNLFIVQTDNPLVLQAIEDRLTVVFFECLVRLSAGVRVVFLLDTYERNTLPGERWQPNVTDRWITRELLGRIRDGRLDGVLAILGGEPLPDLGAEWRQVIGPLPLGRFTVTDVSDYLRINRELNDLSDEEIQTLYEATQGNPQLLGLIGDNLEQAARPVPADDW